MRNKMIICTLMLLTNSVLANGFKLCGEYIGEGKLLRKNDRLVLLLDEKSNSEIKVDLGQYDKSHKLNIGINAEIKFLISSSCKYSCPKCAEDLQLSVFV